MDDANVENELFQDLDDAHDLDELMSRIHSSTSTNFLLHFGPEHARAAFDQPAVRLAEWTTDPVLNWASTRWVNIWNPFQQQEILASLAHQYNFSPRLLALMCSDPRQSQSRQSVPRNGPKAHHFWSRRWQTAEHNEAGIGLDELGSQHSSNASSESVAHGNLYKVLNDIWHYSSVDFGRRYVCVGYNSLYGTKNSVAPEEESKATDEEDDYLTEANSCPLPYCLRLWTWLVLCDDNTVITINEDPFPFAQGKLSVVQQRILVETRRNLANVFRSLSTVDRNSLMMHSPMSVLPIRTRLEVVPVDQDSPRTRSDGPGLLFYYLFENWHNSYTLVTRKESRYGVELEQLRQEMLRRPRLGQIERLDRIGKELAVLRRHYGSYIHIVDRLLEPFVQAASPLVPGANQAVILGQVSRTASFDQVRPIVVEKESVAGGFLNPAARMRFKRLRDLIDLYALDEVGEYIKQKDAMVAMNFSLIAVKQSTDVERLTRITLLLTKATILFLPVSLMTEYFSVPLKDLEYSASTFWAAFGVVFALSWLALLGFGVFSGTLQAGEMWMEISRTIGRWIQRRRGVKR